MDFVQGRVVLLLASFLVVYIQPSSMEMSKKDCSLLPSDHFWITCQSIVTPEGIISGAVEVKEEYIVSVVEGEGWRGKVKGAYVFDCGEAVVMPGLIDVGFEMVSGIRIDSSWVDVQAVDGVGLSIHWQYVYFGSNPAWSNKCQGIGIFVNVHLNEPGREDWEGFSSGTKAAAAGGVTTIIDMPFNGVLSTTSEETLRLKVKAAEDKIHVDVGFWGGLVPENAFNSSALESLLKAGVLGLKSVMGPLRMNDFPMTNASHIKEGLHVVAKFKRPLLVHAETQVHSESYSEPQNDDDDTQSYSTYIRTRPPSWEENAIRDLLTVTKDTRPGGSAEGARLHILHLSDARSSLDLIKGAKHSGDKIMVDTSPHYLAFSAEEIQDGDTRFKCDPPIREATNREKLREALLEGYIDMLSSDHSPTIPDHKYPIERDFFKAWSGISSLQFALPATWYYGKRYGMTLDQLVSSWSERTAELAGQNLKGAIKIGKHADIVVWEPDVEFVLDKNHTTYFEHPNISPYMGTWLSGKVKATFVGGKLVYWEGKFAPDACGKTILAKIKE